MRKSSDRELPSDLAEVAETIRRYGPEPSGPQLERVRTQAIRRASGTTIGRGFMRSKIVTLVLAAGLVATGGTAGVIAATGGSGSKSAAKSQYVPGKGCGDRNHTHTGPAGNPANDDCPPPPGGQQGP